jgi:hypothetical protein
MKTESQFPSAYLDFNSQHGIPSKLRRDNVESDFQKIYGDLVILDQWTELYIPWQNPAEHNGDKYLKSHAQSY